MPFILRDGNLVVVVVVVVTTVVCVAGAYEKCPKTSSDCIAFSGVEATCSFWLSFPAEIVRTACFEWETDEGVISRLEGCRILTDAAEDSGGTRGGFIFPKSLWHKEN